MARADDWFVEASTDVERFSAQRHKAYMLYAFGDVEEAIRRYEAIMDEIGRARGTREDLGNTKLAVCNNLAYAYADIVNTTLGERLEARLKAREYLSVAEGLVAGLPDDDELGSWKKASNSGYKGIVAIMCGETLEEIEGGVRMCEESVRAMDPEFQDGQKAFLPPP